MKEGALHELPGGWVWTRLGEIAGKLQSGGTPLTKVKEFYENGTIPFLKIEDMVNAKKYLYNTATKITEEGLNNSSAWVVPENSLLYSMYASYGVPVINKIKLSTSQAIIAFLPPNNLIYIDYVYYYLWSIKPTLKTFIRGTTQENLNGAIVSNLPFPLPPLPEQRAIVSKIEQFFSDLDNGIENFKNAQAQLKLYRQSVLKAACEGKLVPTEAELARAEGRDYEPADVLLARILKERREKWNGKGKYKEATEPIINTPKLPEGWCWVTFNQIGKWYGGGTPSTGNSSYWVNGNIPWISPKDMKYLKIHESEDKITDLALENSSANLIPAGSILFVVRSGILKRILPVALTMVDAAVNQDIKSLTPHAPIDADYILVTALAFNEAIRYSCAKAGTTVESIEVPALQMYAIPLPPLAEQRRIVLEVERRLTISDKLGATITESFQKAEALRQSILKKAFEGKLLNKNELEEARNAPDWEPAEKLLERIKAEKMNIKTTNKDKK
jgi:type I restriction enzyme S subunit